MNYWLHPLAESELTDAALYYLEYASSKIADAFLTEFERVVALLQENPKIGTCVAEGLRIHPFRRFPYSIVYREAEFGPRIYAFCHQRREPAYWQTRT